MIDNEYYKKYKGPNLTYATLDNVNITDVMKNMYGPDNNWYSKLWKYNEMFGYNSLNKQFYVEFKSNKGRSHWFYGYVSDLHQYFVAPRVKS